MADWRFGISDERMCSILFFNYFFQKIFNSIEPILYLCVITLNVYTLNI